jgi:hypothetical protein
MNAVKTILAILLMLPCAAWAERGDLPFRTDGFYLGLGVGYNQMELKKNGVDISGGDVAYRLTVGYRFPQKWVPYGISFAVEADYLDMGDVSDTSLGSYWNLEVDGFDFFGVGYLPISRAWDFFGKFGVYVWDGKLAADGVQQPQNGATDWAGGLGFAWRTGKAVGLEFELERFNLLDGAWLASASWTYQFK